MNIMIATRNTSVALDYAAIRHRQQATLAAGDYAVVGPTLQIVGERLCEAIDLRCGERVLDVAAGNRNATLAAARRFAQVPSRDYVGALLDRDREALR
jgi:protein-L-isoaspartate O-methyltransferase